MNRNIIFKGLMTGLLVTCASNALAVNLPVSGNSTESGNATYDDIAFTGDFALTIDSGAIIDTTNVTNTVDGEASIAVTAGSTLNISGDVGTSPLSLKSLSTDASAATINKLSGDIYLQKLDMNAGSTLISTGGTITVIDSNPGVADFTLDGTLNLADTNVNLQDAIEVDGTSAITLSGTTVVSQGFNIAPAVASSTLNISDTSNSGNITISDGADLSLTGTNTARTGAISVGNGSTLNIDNDDTVTLGAINGTAASTGAVDFTKSFTLDNAIGATNSLASVEVTGAGIVLTAGSNITADNINFDGAAELEVSNATINADITTNVGGEGTVTFNGTGRVIGDIGTVADSVAAVEYVGSTSSLNTNIFANAINLSSGATVSANSNAVLNTAALTIGTASRLNLGTNDISTTGTLDISGASTFGTSITSASNYGTLTTTGAATIAADTLVNINVTDRAGVKQGDTYTFIDSGAGAGVANVTNATDNTNLFDFIQNSNTEDLGYTSQVTVSFDTDTTGLVTDEFGTSIQTDIVGGNLTTSLADVLHNLAGLPASQQLTVMTNMVPELNGARVETTFENQNRIYDTIRNRLKSNDTISDADLWVQTSLISTDKDKVTTIDGYNSDAKSITVGIDGKVNAKTNVGLAFTHTKTDIDGSDTFIGNKTDVDSYNITAYGATALENGTIIDAQATLGKSNYETTRNLTVIGAGIAKGDIDAMSYGINANVSKNYDYNNGISITPVVGLAYNHVNFGNYTETNSAAALQVEDASFESLKSKIGLEVAFAKTPISKTWNAKPQVHASWNHELIDNNYGYDAKLVNSLKPFSIDGVEPEANSYTIGAGINLSNTTNWTIGASYDANLASDSSAHIARLLLRKTF